MNGQTGSRWLTAMVGLTGALAAIAGAAGVFFRGDLATREFVTVRGDTVEILTGGVYRLNGLNIASEGVGWDLVTLCVVVPALALTLPSLLRGTLRATLLSAGFLVYFLYQYAEYATALAYGPFFLLYVAIVALSLSGTALLLARVHVAELPERFGPRFPRRAMIAFGLYMAILLGGMWLPLIAATFNADRVTQLYGGTTLVVQAFDLGILVPVGLFTAVTVYRRLPVGYLLSAVVIVKGASVALGIVAMLVVEAFATGEAQLPPIVIFALTALAGAAIAVRIYRGIDAGEVLIEGPPVATAAVTPTTAH
jgi:hypothetical protein